MKTKLLSAIIILLSSFSYIEAGNIENIASNIVENNINVRAGESGAITIKIRISDKNYIYSNPKGPGVGRPTTVEVKHSDNFDFKTPEYPKGKKYKASGDPDFVWIYTDEVSIVLPFDVKPDSKPGKYTIPIVVNALLCSDKSCTPYESTINSSISVIAGSLKETAGKHKDIISSGHSDLKEENKNIPEGIPDFQSRFLSNVSVSNILQAIFYGFIAGFLLNFMPCVLPVISIKILDLIKLTGQSRKENIKMGLIFAAGILVSFSILAFLAAFFNYNWGGLFQSSLFLIIMIVIVFIFALSLFDMFMINAPSFSGKAIGLIGGRHGQAFSKGLLATLLATPCSGPFLGGALAWAFTQSHIVIFTIFISVGIGMSSPYIILTANPGLLKFIPKPGNWMITFQRVMGFLLLGTAVYLISILRQSLVVPVLWLLLFIALAFCQYGKYCSMVMPLKTRIISGLAFVLLIAAGIYFSSNYYYKSQEEDQLFESNEKTFSMDLLLENRDRGRISMVTFTADWCPNCKLVEKTSLHTDKVAKSIAGNSIDFLIADLTRSNTEATALLNKLGSRSIPFLALFPAGEKFLNPVCLRDIYSEDDVLKAIEIAK